MSDRKDKLCRQRDLLREHLAWLEREIESTDAESGEPPLEPPLVVYREPQAPAEVESILAEFRREAPEIKEATKRGCVMWFALGMVLLVAAAFLMYRIYYVPHAPAR